MNGCRSSTQGSNRKLNPVLRQTYYIHVPFDHKNFTRIPDSFSGLIEPIKLSSFFEYRCFWRIQVFGLTFLNNTATKTNNVSAFINDWKHNSVAKTIVSLAAFGLDYQPCCNKTIGTVIRKYRREVLPTIRRITNTKTLGNFT